MIACDIMGIKHFATEESNHWHISGYLKAWCISAAFYYYLPLSTLCPSHHIFSLNCVFNHQHRFPRLMRRSDSDVCPRLAWLQFNYDKKPAHLLGLNKEIPSQPHHKTLSCSVLPHAFHISAAELQPGWSSWQKAPNWGYWDWGFIIHTWLTIPPCFLFALVFINNLHILDVYPIRDLPDNWRWL